jgi:hypothetical protein
MIPHCYLWQFYAYKIFHLCTEVIDLPAIQLLENLFLVCKVCHSGPPLIFGFHITVAKIVIMSRLPSMSVTVDKGNVGSFWYVDFLFVLLGH